MSKYLAGVDLGGTKIACLATDLEGNILVRDQRATGREAGPEAVITNIRAGITSLADRVGKPLADLVGIGIGAPGPLTVETGIIHSSANLGLVEYPIVDAIESYFGVPTFLNNDANAAGLAEWRLGAGEQCRNMLYVTVSTGVGAGLILEKKLFMGSHDFAGEFGHVTAVVNGPLCGCGKRGCLEAVASGTAIGRKAREALAHGCPSVMTDLVNGEIEKVDSRIVGEAAAQEDWLAGFILDEAIEYLGKALADVTTLLNLDRIVIGGGVSKIGDRFIKPLASVIRLYAMKELAEVVEVKEAALGDDSGALGAICLVMEEREGR